MGNTAKQSMNVETVCVVDIRDNYPEKAVQPFEIDENNLLTSSSSSVPLKMQVQVPVEDSAYACEVLLSLRSDVRMLSTPTAAAVTVSSPPPCWQQSEGQQQKTVSPERSSVTFAPATTSPAPFQQESAAAGQKRKAAAVDDSGRAKRSDSSHTDSEADDSSGDPLSLKLRIKLSPPRSPSKQMSSYSPRKLNSPRSSNSTSPRLKFKRIRMSPRPGASSASSSSPFPGAQGAPPSEEEFARIVRQHEQQQQQAQGHAAAVARPYQPPAAGASSAPPLPMATVSSSRASGPGSGPLPGLVSTQLPNQIRSSPFNTATSPLLSSLLNPDYPTNKAIIANVLEDNQS
jgi:hypothetical protein